MQPPPAASVAGDAAPLTVRQVNDLIRGAIRAHLPATMHVVGEIGDLSRPGSGHLYLTLKDADSELRCVMWRSSAAGLRFTPQEGMQVVATGELDVYTPRGTYQLVIRRIEPVGVGALELRLRQLRETLSREGLFDPARKRALPRASMRVAVVTSPSGAAIRDILRTMQRRFPACEIIVAPVRVQGEGAADEIASAITGVNALSESLGGIDALIVGRGGGSLEDLWAFNEEKVVRAIYASAIPVVSAVGHETDVTLSDLAADLRAATPTAAAELLAPDAVALREWLHASLRRTGREVGRVLELGSSRLRELRQRGPLSRPSARFEEAGQRIDECMYALGLRITDRVAHERSELNRHELSVLRFGAGAEFGRAGLRLDRQMHGMIQRLLERIAARRLQRHEALHRLDQLNPLAAVTHNQDMLTQAGDRLARGLQAQLQGSRQSLAAVLARLNACEHMRILARGYAVVRDARTRRVIRSVREVHAGQRLAAQVQDGEVRATADDPRQPRLFD